MRSDTPTPPAYWHADNGADPARDTGDTDPYPPPNPEECCFAFSLSDAIDDVIAGHGSARYMLYGFGGAVYGHGATPPPTPAEPATPPIPPPPTPPIEDAVLKQFTELWWWLAGTTDPSGFTGQGKLFVPNGLGTFVAQLL